MGRQVAGLGRSLSLDPVAFLPHVDNMWRELCASQMTIRQIFLYLDRSYVITATHLRSLFDLGLSLLRQHLAAAPQVRRAACGLVSACVPECGCWISWPRGLESGLCGACRL